MSVQTSKAAANHAKAAIRAGATLEELHAAAGIAALFRGVAAFKMAGEIPAGLSDKQTEATRRRPLNPAAGTAGAAWLISGMLRFL